MTDFKTNLIEYCNIKDKSFCFCWSGKFFWECCKNNLNKWVLNEKDIQDIQKFVSDWFFPKGRKNKKQMSSTKWKKCLCPLCNGKSIKSHFLLPKNFLKKKIRQHHKFLSLDYDNNYNLISKLTDPNSANIKLPLWCNKHDHWIFKFIDDHIEYTGLNDQDRKKRLWLRIYKILWKQLRRRETWLELMYSYFLHWFIRNFEEFSKEYDTYCLVKKLFYQFDFESKVSLPPIKYFNKHFLDKNLWNNKIQKIIRNQFIYTIRFDDLKCCFVFGIPEKNWISFIVASFANDWKYYKNLQRHFQEINFIDEFITDTIKFHSNSI